MLSSRSLVALASAVVCVLLAVLVACRRQPKPWPVEVLAEARHSGLRRHGPAPGRAVDAGRQAAEHVRSSPSRAACIPLATTHSPESPTAWASFATGVNAGKHNIYDFLVRDTTTYLPDLGMVTRTPPKFLFDYIPISKPKLDVDPRRHLVLGDGRQGRRAIRACSPCRSRSRPKTVAERRAAVGPSAARHSRHDGHVLLLRDRSEPLRGRQHRDGRHPQASGLRGRRRATTELDGPPSPIVRQKIEAIRRKGPTLSESDRASLAELQAAQDVRVPFTIRWNRPAKTATVEIDGETIALEPGQVDAVDRPHLQGQHARPAARHGADAADERRQRAAALRVAGQLQAGQPAGADLLSRRRSPGDLYKRLGYYRTLGWAEATWPLNEGRMDEKTFMDDLDGRLRRSRAR